MDEAKRAALEAAGWKIGDAADFLELNDADREKLDLRVEEETAARGKSVSPHDNQKAR